MTKAKRHYESWSIDEARSFMNYYLANITRKDYSIVLDNFSKEVDRTYDAIAFRVKEVLSILTDGDQGLKKDKWTKEFIYVVDEKLNEGSISKAKMIMLFE
jgi:hypothetical protein|tara:strand:- start:1077 stop:1379 length:303 start_codon:yes stop_codon:yes gene_type:complete